MNHIPLWLSESAQSMWLWTGEGRNVAGITLGSDIVFTTALVLLYQLDPLFFRTGW